MPDRGEECLVLEHDDKDEIPGMTCRTNGTAMS